MKTLKSVGAVFLLAFAAADSGFCKAPEAKPSAILEPDCPGPGCPRGKTGDWQGGKAVFESPASTPGGNGAAAPAGQAAKSGKKKSSAKKPAANPAKDN